MPVSANTSPVNDPEPLETQLEHERFLRLMAEALVDERDEMLNVLCAEVEQLREENERLRRASMRAAREG